jgi:hypothetical protein
MQLEKQERRSRTTSGKYSFHFIHEFISFVYISFMHGTRAEDDATSVRKGDKKMTKHLNE